MLAIYTTSRGWQFTPFASMASCEAARALVQKQWDSENAAYEKQGFKLVAGTAPRVFCMAG